VGCKLSILDNILSRMLTLDVKQNVERGSVDLERCEEGSDVMKREEGLRARRRNRVS
jgi:hypothetical protein